MGLREKLTLCVYIHFIWELQTEGSWRLGAGKTSSLPSEDQFMGDEPPATQRQLPEKWESITNNGFACGRRGLSVLPMLISLVPARGTIPLEILMRKLCLQEVQKLASQEGCSQDLNKLLSSRILGTDYKSPSPPPGAWGWGPSAVLQTKHLGDEPRWAGSWSFTGRRFLLASAVSADGAA